MCRIVGYFYSSRKKVPRCYTLIRYPLSVAEVVPSFTEETSNPSPVNEGGNITLRWTYDIDGTFRGSEFIFLRTRQTIAAKDSNGLAVNAAFSDRVQVFISESEATLTLLHVNRSDDGGYVYRMWNYVLGLAASVVNVFVQCK